jgi:hypothetical protein
VRHLYVLGVQSDPSLPMSLLEIPLLIVCWNMDQSQDGVIG